MLNFFFNRKAPMLYVFNALALVFFGLLIFERTPWQKILDWQTWSSPLSGAVFFWLYHYLFFNFLRIYSWYPGEKASVGLRWHFQQMSIPVVYLTCLVLLLEYWGWGGTWLWALGALLLPLHYVAWILIFFHVRDKSPLPVGYFSENYYLKES